MLLVLLFLCYGIICWYYPRVALGLLLALLPTYLLRFDAGGIPMTVLEGFILILAARMMFGRNRRAGFYTLPSGREGVKPSPTSDGITHAPSPFADRMVVLAAAWVIAGTLAALGSDAGVKSWGLWKAYIVEPVVLYFIIRTLASESRDGWETAAGNPKSEYRNPKQSLQKHEIRNNTQTRFGFRISDLFRTSIFDIRYSQPVLLAGSCLLNPLRHIILPLTIGAAGVAAVAVWQYFSGYGIPFPWQDIATRRVTSVFGYPNAVGLYLVPIIPLALGLLAISRRATPPLVPPLEEGESQHILPTIAALAFAAAVFLIAIVAVFFTRGAGAMVAVVAALASLPFLAVFKRLLSRHARSVAIAIIAMWVVACLVITAVLPYQGERRWGPSVVQKLTFQQWSGSVRLSQYREMWKLLRDHPIRGAGLSGYPQAIQQYKEKQNVETFQYPHNLLLAVWSEMGFLGLLIFLAITITFFARAFGQRRPATVIAAMLAVLVFGLVDIPIFKNDLAVLWWTLLALGTVGFQRDTLGAYGYHS